jgi:hypothetical protein
MVSAMVPSRSGQLGLRCTIEPNCSSLCPHLAGTSVTRDRALDTCEPSCMPGAARHFFIPVVHSPVGHRGVHGSTGALVSRRRGRGHVAAPEPTSAGWRGPELRNMWQRRSSPLGEAEPRAMGHVAVSETTSVGRRGSELGNTWQHRSSTQKGGEVQGHGTRGGSGAHLRKEAWSEATIYVAARGCTPCSLS